MDNGVPASPSGSQASPGAADASPPSVSIPNAVEDHGDWVIWYAPMPIECREYDWHYARKQVREEYDFGSAETRDMCLQSIDWLEEQDRIAETPEGKAETERFVDSGMRQFHQLMLIQQLSTSLRAAHSILVCNGRGFLDATHHATVKKGLEALEEWDRDHAH